MMKNSVNKLLSLLGLCSENKDEAEKQQLLVRITRSPDYKELSHSVALKMLFEEYFSMPRLEVMNDDELKKREELLHKLVSFQSQMLRCIRAGNGPELPPADMPDFASSSSIARLLDKISLAPDITNYTNIRDADALALFSEKTVKSARKCLEMLPISLTRKTTISEADITEQMGKTLYCIPIDEFERAHHDLLDSLQRDEKTIENERFRRKKHILLKISVLLLCFGAVYSFSQFGVFSSSFEAGLTVFLLIVSIIYMIWG